MIDLIPRWLLLALLAASSAFAGVQSIRLYSARAEASNAKLEAADLRVAIAQANTEAANKAASLQSQVVKAQNESIKRETALRDSINNARSESDGLRGDAASLRDQLASLASDARAERAVALGAVLGQCANRYQVLASRCDRHVNDLRTLADAWPK